MRYISYCMFVCSLLLFTTCKKTDKCEDHLPKQKCQVSESIVTISGEPRPDDPFHGGGTFTLYKKYYNPYNGRVEKVLAGLFALVLTDTITMQLQYAPGKVYFLTSQSDTILIASFFQKKLIQIESKSGPFENATFGYTAGRLTRINNEYVQYDGFGNVTRITDDTSQAAGGTFYTYDLSVKANKQWYSAEFISESKNAIYLAQFMGWLPNLEPQNKRLSFRIEERDPETGEAIVIYRKTLVNHVYDLDGNLIRYDLQCCGTSYFNSYDCNQKAALVDAN